MFIIRFNQIMIGVVLFLFLVGCSSLKQNPESLDTINPEALVTHQMPIIATKFDEKGIAVEGMGAIGLFNVSVNPNELNASLSSIRKGSSQDVLEVVDITNFMQLRTCTNCVKIKSVSLNDDGKPVLEIGIRHPFPAGNPLAPITGRNRADLHVFNVEGIVVSNLSTIPDIMPAVANLRVLNADGYTGYLDGVLDEIYPTPAAIHPYILHFDDYSKGNFDASNPMGFESVTDPPPSGNLVMAMGCDYDFQEYVFDVNESFEFIFVVGCTYGISADTMADRFNPVYRVPQFNKKAASEVHIDIVKNQLREDVLESYAEININIVDVNNMAYNGDELDKLKIFSYVDQVIFNLPGVIESPVEIPGYLGYGEGLNPQNPLVFDLKIKNDRNAPVGVYTGIVKVLDRYETGLNERPELLSRDGVKRVDPYTNPVFGVFNIDEFATYQIFNISVAPSDICGPISGSIVSPTGPVGPIRASEYVIFTLEAHSENGGDPTMRFEMDPYYDGINFHDHGGGYGNEYYFFPSWYFPNSCEVDIPYTFHVAFKYYDSCDPPNGKIIGVCDVTVNECFDLSLKNIRLREDAIPIDIASWITNHDGYGIIILYSDGQGWIYNETNYYQQTDAYYLFTPEVNLAGHPGKLCNFRIDGFTTRYGPTEIRNVIASNADGIGKDNNFEAWPAQVFDENQAPLGVAPILGTGGPVPDVFSFKDGDPWEFCQGFLTHDKLTDEDSIRLSICDDYDCTWCKMTPAPNVFGLSGFDKVYIPQVKGVFTVGGDQIWMLENPDYYCARFKLESGSYCYDNRYFGTGYQTEDDEGWYNAKDIAVCEGDGYELKYLVLDELSDGSGVVKVFDHDYYNDTITSVGHFNVPDEFSSKPVRITAQPYGEVFILHGDNTNGYYMSIFYDWEIP